MRHVDTPVEKKNIVVLGSGAFGTALGYCAARNGHNVVIISSLKETVDKINTTRKHPSRLLDANYTLPENVRASSDPNELLSADYILHTIPVQYSRCVYHKVFFFFFFFFFSPSFSREALAKYDALGLIKAPIISASKGIESVTLLYMSQLVPDVLKRPHKMAFLSGPSFAKELVENQPTAVVAAAEDHDMCMAVQNIFLSNRLRVYTVCRFAFFFFFKCLF